MSRRSSVALPVLALAALLGAEARAASYSVEAKVLWKAALDHGGKSSPRAADFNGDGFDDVVAGAGLEDGWGEVVAFDGKTGGRLWDRRFPDEVLLALRRLTDEVMHRIARLLPPRYRGVYGQPVQEERLPL